MVTHNSIESYLEMVVSEELGEKQRVVYEYIREHPDCSYNDIARALKQHHNTVTARIKELRDAGYVITSGAKRDEYTGKNNNIYRIRLEGEPPDDTEKDVRPRIPREVVDFLRSKADRNATAGEFSTTKWGVTYTVFRTSDKVCFNYGNFLKLRNIMTVCEDSSQERVIISGANFTVIFKLD